MKGSKAQASLRSSAAEYLTYVASVGDGGESFEIRYEDENIWLTQKMLAYQRFPRFFKNAMARDRARREVYTRMYPVWVKYIAREFFSQY